MEAFFSHGGVVVFVILALAVLWHGFPDISLIKHTHYHDCDDDDTKDEG